jgi:hypothetical protein
MKKGSQSLRREGATHRKIDVCMNCQEELPIAAHGLCFCCYRRVKRAEKKEEDMSSETTKRDLHSPGLRKEHKVILKAHASILSNLADLRCSKADIHHIQEILRPYLEPVSEFVTINKAEEHESPNAEDDDESNELLADEDLDADPDDEDTLSEQ